jgi:flagellar biosynthesis anti-sigma factor FlgM
MKIPSGYPPQPIAVEAEAAAERPTAQAKSAGKKSAAKDTIDFSAYLKAKLQAQQDVQAQRVDVIKARLEAGNYQISSREVAKRMLPLFLESDPPDQDEDNPAQPPEKRG